VAAILQQNSKNHTAIIDQFLLELIHNCIMSLRLCQRDKQTMGTEKKAVDALKKLEAIMMMHKPGSDACIFAEAFLEKRVSSRGGVKAPRRMHEDLASFAEWVYNEIGSISRPSRRYCMSILPKVCKVLVDQGGKHKNWIAEKYSSTALIGLRSEDWPDNQEHITNEPLKKLTARYSQLETDLDVCYWLLNADYVRPSKLFDGKGKELARCIKQFVDQSEKCIESTFPIATPTELRLHALQKSKCIYATLKLVDTVLARYTSDEKERKNIPPVLYSKEMFRLLFLCLLAPGKKLRLDTLSDTMVDVEIPRMCIQTLRTICKCESCGSLRTGMKEAWVNAKSLPHLGLSDPASCLANLGSDGFSLLLRGYLHLSSDRVVASGLGVKIVNGELLFTDGVMGWLFDRFKEKDVFEPSFKELAESLLRLALQSLEGKFRSRVASELFTPLSLLRVTGPWRESKSWAFYVELREEFDIFLCKNADLLNPSVLMKIGRADTPHATSVLCNVIERQCREERKRMADSNAKTCSGREESSTELLQVCLAEPTNEWIKYLVESRPTGNDALPLPDYERRKTAVEIVGKLLLLISLQESAGPTVEGGKEKIFIVLEKIMKEEKDFFVKTRDDRKQPEVDVLVTFLESCVPLLSCSSVETVEQASEMMKKVEKCLAECFPLDSVGLSQQQISSYTSLFNALLRLVHASRSRAVLPLVRNFLLNDSEHPYKDTEQIRDTLDEYVLRMPEEEAKATALEIIRMSQQQTNQNPNVLRLERCVVDKVCGRLLRRLNQVRGPWPLILTLDKPDSNLLCAAGLTRRHFY